MNDKRTEVTNMINALLKNFETLKKMRENALEYAIEAGKRKDGFGQTTEIFNYYKLYVVDTANELLGYLADNFDSKTAGSHEKIKKWNLSLIEDKDVLSDGDFALLVFHDLITKYKLPLEAKKLPNMERIINMYSHIILSRRRFA